MAQEDNKKVKNSSTSYSTTKRKPKGEFTCSWVTFWTAIGVIVVVIGGGYAHFHGMIKEQIEPIKHELDLLRDTIRNNEENRDKNIALQIQVIEQKIEIIKNKHEK